MAAGDRRRMVGARLVFVMHGAHVLDLLLHLIVTVYFKPASHEQLCHGRPSSVRQACRVHFHYPDWFDQSQINNRKHFGWLDRILSLLITGLLAWSYTYVKWILLVTCYHLDIYI
jgi:hypothetical protein